MNKAEKRTKEQEIDDELDKVRKANLCYFFAPYKWQMQTLDTIRRKNTTAVIISNKNGKTALGANTVISWALGYEPWNEVDKNYPDAVCVDGIYFKFSSLGIKPPVKIRIVGLDWREHIGDTIVPELKKWAPDGMYHTKKNEQGVEHIWEWFNGSEFRIMCNSQDDMVFESFRCQAAWLDEPPERNKYIGISRGVYLDNGKILFTMTPLKAAWVLDDIVLSDRGDIGVIDKLDIRANEDTYRDDCNKLYSLGLNEQQVSKYFDLLLFENKAKGRYVTDKGKGAEEFVKSIAPIEKHEDIYKLRMLTFVKNCEIKQVPARIFGEFLSLVGRVLKDFNPDIHLIDEIEPSKVPTDWVIVPMIDWHPGKEIAISYWAIDKHNIHYCIREIWEHLKPQEIVDEIVRMKKAFSWNINDAFIDPIAKGSTSYAKNIVGSHLEDVFSQVSEALAEEEITLNIPEKRPESGITNIETRLRGVNGVALSYICRNLTRHIYEINRWIYGEDEKPVKENDHFMENWYRFELTGIQYEDNIIQKYTPSSAYREGNAWMGM